MATKLVRIVELFKAPPALVQFGRVALSDANLVDGSMTYNGSIWKLGKYWLQNSILNLVTYI